MKQMRSSSLVPGFALVVICVSSSLAWAQGEGKVLVLSDIDRKYLDGLSEEFLFDPAIVTRVRIKTSERDVWTKSRSVEREGWLVPAKGDRPARIYFTDDTPRAAS